MNNITGYIIPTCKQQKEFEDLVKELINIMADMSEQQQISIFEYAQTVYSNRNNKYNPINRG